MFIALKNKNAQAVTGEYLLIFFIVAAVVIAMTIYFKRAVQARIHDARDYMVSEVRVRTEGVYNGDLYKEYEPYYGNSIATVTRYMEDETRVLPAASSGIFQKFINETVWTRVNSETAPPREYNRTTPIN